MRIRGKENRQLILELLEQSNSVEQHIYYQKDGAPEKIQSYSKKSLNSIQTSNRSFPQQIEDHKKNPTIN